MHASPALACPDEVETKEIEMSGELSFFELGVEDPARGRAFYEAPE